MADLFENPMGTDGFEFVEYTAPDTEALGRLFEGMGFSAVARHRSKRVTLYKQGFAPSCPADKGSCHQCLLRP